MEGYTMTQFYFETARELLPHALPDAETFYFDGEGRSMPCMVDGDGAVAELGWYYWACFPGCLPDGDPIGPFDTEADAIADAQEMVQS